MPKPTGAHPWARKSSHDPANPSPRFSVPSAGWISTPRRATNMRADAQRSSSANPDTINGSASPFSAPSPVGKKAIPSSCCCRMASPFPASCSAIKPAHSIGDSGDGSQFAASMRQSSNTPSQNSPHFSATRNDVFSASLVRRGELTTRRIPLISNSEPPPKTHLIRVSRRVARQSRHQYPKAVASQKYRRDASRSRLPGKTPASAK